jgi:hypothetical protein
MRLSMLVVALIVAAPFGAGAEPFRPFEGQSVLGGRLYGPNEPWCSHQDIGDNVEEDCSFRSFEACRRVAMGVNNTFCTPNPAFAMDVRPVRRHKSHRR